MFSPSSAHQSGQHPSPSLIAIISALAPHPSPSESIDQPLSSTPPLPPFVHKIASIPAHSIPARACKRARSRSCRRAPQALRGAAASLPKSPSSSSCAVAPAPPRRAPPQAQDAATIPADYSDRFRFARPPRARGRCAGIDDFRTTKKNFVRSTIFERFVWLCGSGGFPRGDDLQSILSALEIFPEGRFRAMPARRRLPRRGGAGAGNGFSASGTDDGETGRRGNPVPGLSAREPTAARADHGFSASVPDDGETGRRGNPVPAARLRGDRRFTICRRAEAERFPAVRLPNRPCAENRGRCGESTVCRCAGDSDDARGVSRRLIGVFGAVCVSNGPNRRRAATTPPRPLLSLR